MDQVINKISNNGDSWEQLLSFLPNGWDKKCRELGAIRRKLRKFSGPEAVLRTLLIHLLQGCSLRVTKTIAQIGKIVDVSDVAVLNRLDRSGEWFRWMAERMINDASKYPPPSLQRCGMKVRVFDATHVSEPGSSGSNWRVHYAFDLPQLHCAELKVTDYTTGETFKNFKVEKKTLHIADRGYFSAQGIEHVVRGGADVLVRMTMRGPTLYHPDGRKFGLLSRLQSLKVREMGDWPVYITTESGIIRGRVCAVKKSRAETHQAMQQVIYEYARKQQRATKAALEAARYIFVFTTLSPEQLSVKDALEMYRGRWQIEVAFHRLKSIVGIGHVPKQNPVGAQAWIQGKLFCALLIQTQIDAAERFSPRYGSLVAQAA